MSVNRFKFATDTSMMCVFDPALLKHRLDDEADWWCDPSTEVAEVNTGNVLFVGLPGDGIYWVTLVPQLSSPMAEVKLKITSGRVFVGAGEEVSSDGLEPECLRGGVFLDLAAGDYLVSVACIGNEIQLSLRDGAVGSTNLLEAPIRLPV